jgi:Abortive infection C-terminus
MKFKTTNRATLVDKAMELQDGLVAEATGGDFPGSETGIGDEFVEGKIRYSKLRDELIFAPETGSWLPDFVRKCFSLQDFRQFIRGEIEDHAARRRFLWDSFRPLISALNGDPLAPAGMTITSRLESLKAHAVEATWYKALARRNDDPEGAITAARTLLESVCKHLIEETGQTCDEKADLPKLYARCAESLSLAPDRQTEKSFKTILGSCQSVVGELAHIRNKISDAHGRGRRQMNPASRHAELAVNLAGSVAAFLVATWMDKKTKTSPFRNLSFRRVTQETLLCISQSGAVSVP